MAYTLLYHPAVKSVDLPLINRKMYDRIQRAIEGRLLVDPQHYGLPLRRGLHGFYKMRVGDYRVVYEIAKSEIHIFIIAHRRHVYTDVLRRLTSKRR